MEEYGPNLGMPHTRALGNGLFEIRAKAEEGIGRAFFCTMVGKKIVILHSFIKRRIRHQNGNSILPSLGRRR